MNAISSVTINQSADWIALSSSEMGQLCVWEWQSQTHVLKQQSHFGSMSSLAYSPDAQYIVTGGLDGKVNSLAISVLHCPDTGSISYDPVPQFCLSVCCVKMALQVQLVSAYLTLCHEI